MSRGWKDLVRGTPEWALGVICSTLATGTTTEASPSVAEMEEAAAILMDTFRAAGRDHVITENGVWALAWLAEGEVAACLVDAVAAWFAGQHVELVWTIGWRLSMVRLFLDDERDPREWLPNMRWFRGRDVTELDEWVWAKTAPEAEAILEQGDVLEVSLDHDLGEETEVGTGDVVLRWIEARVALDDNYEPPIIHIHTSNLGARHKMELGVQGIANLLDRRRLKR